MSRLAKTVYSAPQPGQQLASEDRVESDDSEISARARSLTAGLKDARDR
jgi:hypothetical protein